jgi:hypothetical protein
VSASSAPSGGGDRGGEHDADEPAGGGDRVELGVGEVAGRRAQRVDAGVRGDQRRAVHPRDVPEARLVEVAEVDRDAELRAPAHETPTGRRQPGTGVGRAGEQERDAVGERVRAAPHRPERAQARRVPELERLQRRVDRLGALVVDDRREHAVRARRVEVGDRAHDPQVAVALEAEQPSGRLRRRRRGDLGPDRRRELDLHAAAVGVEVDVLGARRRREQGEDPARQAARAGAREVDVPAVAAGGEVGRVLAGDRVVVAVEDGDHAANVTRRRGRGRRTRRRTSRSRRCA